MNSNNSVSWTIKYKPKKFENVCDHKNVISIFERYFENKELPHIIVYGNNGVGKKTIINIFINTILNTRELIKNNFLNLNIINKRGINTIRQEIKNFSKKSVYGKVTHKFILLEEADVLSQDAQFALRRIMEIYSNNTRFILTCNNITGIIEPIISRCSKIYLKKINEKLMINYLNKILEKEDIVSKVEKEDIVSKVEEKKLDLEKQEREDKIEFVVNNCNGNMRKALNILEVLNTMKKNGYTINKQYILELLGEDIINYKEMYERINNLKNLDDIDKLVKYIIYNGYSIKKQIFNFLININNDDKINIDFKSKIIKIIYKLQLKLYKGSGVYIQLFWFFNNYILLKKSV